MLEPVPRDLRGRERSGEHVVVKRHPALVPSGPFLDPGDLTAHRPVEEYGSQVSAR